MQDPGFGLIAVSALILVAVGGNHLRPRIPVRRTVETVAPAFYRLVQVLNPTIPERKTR